MPTTKQKQTKKQRRLNKRIKLVNVLLSILGTAILCIGGTVTIVKGLFSGPSTINQHIQAVAVQQDFPYGEFRATYAAPPLPGISAKTIGILVTVQAYLTGGAGNHAYSVHVQILTPPPTTVSIALDTNSGECSTTHPIAQRYGFQLECWVGAPLAQRQSFDVRATLVYGPPMGTEVVHTPGQPIASLTVGGFKTP